MDVFVALTLLVVVSFLVLWGIGSYYKNQYKQAQFDLSDAAILKLMARANHFLTGEQLAAVTNLNVQQANSRLGYLAMLGVIRSYSDGMGMYAIYQLVEELPEDDVLPISIEGLTDEQIVDAILEYSDDYQITIAEVIVVFGVDIYEAIAILKRLRKSGAVGAYWQNFTRIYVATKRLHEFKKKPTLSQANPERLKIPLPKTVQKIKIPDADVLELAVNHKGRVTASLLCLKLKIPMADAQIKLEELHEEGALLMDVDEENAVIEYHLRDKSLLS